MTSEHLAAYSISIDLQEPQSFSKAHKNPIWKVAMQEEYQARLQNHTWDLVLLTSTQNIIGYKWSIESNNNLMGLLIGIKLF